MDKIYGVAELKGRIYRIYLTTPLATTRLTIAQQWLPFPSPTLTPNPSPIGRLPSPLKSLQRRVDDGREALSRVPPSGYSLQKKQATVVVPLPYTEAKATGKQATWGKPP